MKRIGVDIGGTFTDILVLDEETGATEILKTPSTPDDVADAPITGLRQAIALYGVDPQQVRFVSHGCTIGTNTVIERRGAKTGLITTRGFRDVLELGRVARPADLLYDIYHTKAEVLVPRYLRHEVAERVSYRGEPLVALDEADVRRVVRTLTAAGAEAIAVCLLFSYLYPEHERKISETIAASRPGLYVTISSALSPRYGEYERTSTAVVNAYIGPAFRRYLDVLASYVEQGLRTPLYLMQSNGGVLAAQDAIEQPVRVLESGPTAGVMAAAHIGKGMGLANVISFDMGGTTAKAGLIIAGESVETVEYEVGGVVVIPGSGHLHGRGTGFPISLPAIEVTEVGSGGGSIGWIDAGGAFRVGPRSMGARPGPACYGLGGEEPTVTDAQVALGVINPANFLGGKMKLFPDLSVRTIEERVGKPLRLDLREAARGIIEIANATMAHAIRLVSINRGHDPREFAMLAFGGAGPMHACDIAREVEVPWVVVPLYPGIHSALGLVVSDIVHEYLRAYARRDIDAAALNDGYQQLEVRGRKALDGDRVPQDARLLFRLADARYQGQTYTVTIPVAPTPLTADGVARIVETFHAKHEALYTFRSGDDRVELVNLRLRAVGVIPRPDPALEREGGAAPDEALTGLRRVFFEVAKKSLESRIFQRSRLRPGNVIAGPAIVEQVDSTIAIPPDMVAKVDRYRNLVIGKEAWRESF